MLFNTIFSPFIITILPYGFWRDISLECKLLLAKCTASRILDSDTYLVLDFKVLWCARNPCTRFVMIFQYCAFHAIFFKLHRTITCADHVTYDLAIFSHNMSLSNISESSLEHFNKSFMVMSYIAMGLLC